MTIGIATPIAARVAGISERQLAYWSRTGLVRASIRETTGKGVHRRYSLPDVLALRCVGDLRRAGVSLQACRKVQSVLRDEESTTLSAARLVVFDGRKPDVLLARTEHELVSLLEARGQLLNRVHFIPLRALQRDVRRALRLGARKESTRRAREGASMERLEALVL